MKRSMILADAAPLDAARQAERLASERPTIPVPAPTESEDRPDIAKVPSARAAMDVIDCDLSRDPRSEDYAVWCSADPGRGRQRGAAARRWTPGRGASV